MCCNSAADFLLAVLALIFPPIAVWVKRGVCSADSLINIALCILGYLPGLIHAWYIISSYPDPVNSGYEDIEPGRVYVYTAVHSTNRPRGQQQQRPRTDQPKPQPPQQYGTVPALAATGPQPPRQENAVASPSDLLQQQHAQTLNGGEGSSSQEQQQQPPSYSDVVRGDFKVQTRD